MFANTFQSGFISIFYSVGSNPLQLWDKQVKNGHIRRVVDDEVRSLVLEISGTNVATTYITCPIKPRQSLGIKLPFLVMIIKNMKKYFTFEIQVLDDKDMHRRFRVSNFQSTTKVRPFCTTMPIGLSCGWNQVQFNLADFTKRAYGSTYLETTRIQIHANVRIRRIYFSDQLYSDEELPNEYKLFLPTPGAVKVPPGKDKKAEEPAAEAKKSSKKFSADEMKIQLAEQEIPSGAPPTPAGAPTPSALDQPEQPPEMLELVPEEAVVATEGTVEGGEVESKAPEEVTETGEGGEEAPAAKVSVSGEGGAPPEGEAPAGETPLETPTTEATEVTTEVTTEATTEASTEPTTEREAPSEAPAEAAPVAEEAPAPEAAVAEVEAAPAPAEAPPAEEVPPAPEAAAAEAPPEEAAAAATE